MSDPDPHNLQRFVDAQRNSYETALAEIRAGEKRNHWMWFVFPQLRGLGRSPTAEFYGIASFAEAEAYLDHPLLGARLQQCVDALLPWSDRRTAEAIFGPVDTLKLRSSLSIFDHVQPNTAYARALSAFFAGERDERTLALIRDRR